MCSCMKSYACRFRILIVDIQKRSLDSQINVRFLEYSWKSLGCKIILRYAHHPPKCNISSLELKKCCIILIMLLAASREKKCVYQLHYLPFSCGAAVLQRRSWMSAPKNNELCMVNYSLDGRYRSYYSSSLDEQILDG